MIHIVTHCYSVALPQYAQHLVYQLSSLVIHRPQVPVRITVCLTYEDYRTIDVVKWFWDKQPRLKLDTLLLSKGDLFRRSIGRNAACLNAQEDLTWFTDVDHVFGLGCLDALDRIWESYRDTELTGVSLIYPKQILIHKDHPTGDQATSSLGQDVKLAHVNADDFIPKRYTRAIGGVQIVPRWYLRAYGYLAKSKRFQTPHPEGTKPFPDFRDDVAFRSNCYKDGKVIAIDLPNLFRIRHTKTTYQGQEHATLD